MIDTDIQLSSHFTLFEMCNVKRYGRYNSPSESEISNLRILCDFLELLRCRVCAPVVINSAFRNRIVNAHVGGVPNSDHLKGFAADVRVIGYTPVRLAKVIRSTDTLNSLVGQVIIYPTFLHISINRFTHKSQYLIKKGSRYELY